MWKAILILSTLLAFATTAVIQPLDGSQTPVEGCQSQTELWGSEDGTKYYLCLPGTNIAIEQPCPKDTFFVKNETVSGCVGTTYVNPDCVNLGEPGPCTGINMKQPQPCAVLTNFLLCVTENEAPIELPCPPGTAFVNQQGYLGCFDWAKWRTIRSCPV